MEGFNVKFVGEVEKHPVIYNYNLPGYLRKDVTEKAWDEVAKVINQPASECKEKWRNLRSTLAKNLKPRPSGSGAAKKKPYYLMEAMKFAIPFIKVAGTSSGNLPPEHTVEVSQGDTKHADDDVSLEFPSISTNQHTEDDQPQSPTSPSLPLTTTSTDRPKPLPPTDHLLEIKSEAASPVATETRPKGHKRKRQDSQSEADEGFANYFGAATAQITKTSSPLENSVRKEGLQDFFNSLIPDLLPMTDAELRVFKVKSLLLVDEIFGARSSVHHGTRFQPALHRRSSMRTYGSPVQSEYPQNSPSPSNEDPSVDTSL